MLDVYVAQFRECVHTVGSYELLEWAHDSVLGGGDEQSLHSEEGRVGVCGHGASRTCELRQWQSRWWAAVHIGDGGWLERRVSVPQQQGGGVCHMLAPC